MKYINADRLKEEFQKRFDICKRVSDDDRNALDTQDWYRGKYTAYSECLSFIDSLQREPPIIEEDLVEKRKQECGCRRLSSDGNYQCEIYEGVFGPCDGRCSWIVDCPKLKELKETKRPDVELEKEIDNIIADYSFVKAIDSDGFKVTIDNAKIARHFFELGQRRAAEMYDDVEYNRQRAEEDMLGKTLDEAAEEYAFNNWEDNDYHTGASEGLHFDAIGHTANCFKAGAKWMAGQGVSWEDKMTYYDGFLLYGKDERAFTMEGNFNEGDEVIVQIRKKEESK